MNTFRGSLAHYRMSLVMPALLECAPSSACLALERGPVRRWFLFQQGHLVASSSNQPSEHLSQGLVNLDMMDRLAVASAFDEAERRGEALGTFLLHRGLLAEERLLQALEQKARQAFFDCYLWESGEMELWSAPFEVPTAALRLNLATLHQEAILFQGQWQLARREAGTSLAELLELARDAWRGGDLQRAAKLINEALARGSFPEGQALFRNIETEFCDAASQRIEGLRGTLALAPLPNPLPPELTPNDLCLYFRLQSSDELAEPLRLSTRQLAAYGSIERLYSSGLLLARKEVGGGQSSEAPSLCF